MIKLIFAILLLASPAMAQVQILEDISACNEGDVGKWNVVSKRFICQPSAATPGIMTFVISGACPTGWTEEASLVGVTLFGTSTANGDVGTTGGADSITPTVNSLTAVEQTFTGSALGTHSHGVGTYSNSSDSAGTPTGTVSQPTFTGSALSGGTRKGGTTNPASIIENGAVPSGTVSQPTFTGDALATHSHMVSGSSESVSAGIPAGTNSTSAVTGTLNSFDNRSAFVRVIFCSKD